MFTDNFLEDIAARYKLTEAQKDVFLAKLRSCNQSDDDIAKAIYVPPKTFRVRFTQIYKRFGIPGKGPGKYGKLLQLLSREFETFRDNSDKGVSVAHTPEPTFREGKGTSVTSRQDWGEAPDVSLNFYGRTDELDTLEQWIVTDCCRLVVLLGMGGIGKTDLSVRLAERIQNQFESLIWRTLRNAPPIEDILADLIQFLSNQQEVDLPKTVDGRVSQLIECLRSSRCLVILDNVEAILDEGAYAGRYRKGYEEYGELIRRIGEQWHNSCLLLTSREKFQNLIVLEGDRLPVRFFLLNGLTVTEARQILDVKGTFFGSDEDWETLNSHYGGNPLVLKMLAPSIESLLDGNITEFVTEGLKEGNFSFNDIGDILDRQIFKRLLDAEKQIMYWLAIDREGVSREELQEDILPIYKKTVWESLKSLQWRSLIQRNKNSQSFTQQPVVMEYIVKQLIERICEEIQTEKLEILKSHALLKAQAKEYIRQIQIRLILNTIWEKLVDFYGSKSNVEIHLKELISKLQESLATESNYAVGNLINLLCQFKTDLSGYDFSNVTIWQAYLRDVSLHNTNFAHSELTKCVFYETLGIIFSVAFSSDAQLLATGDADGEIRLWEVKTGKLIMKCIDHERWVRSVAFSPTSNLLASCSDDHTVKLWKIDKEIEIGQCLHTLKGHTNRVRSVAFSPNGNLLISGSDDYTARIWDVNTYQCLRTLKEHKNRVWVVAFSSDGRTIATGSDDHTVRLWDIDTDQCLKTLQGHIDGVKSVAFSRDGRTLASGSEDQTIRIWNVDTGEHLRTLEGHTSWVQSVTFNFQDDVLASGSADKTIRLWNVQTGQCLKILEGHTSRVWSIAFNPDGNMLASGGDDCTVRMWDVQTSQCLKILEGYKSQIWSVAFNPDGNMLASGSEDHTVRLWDIQKGECLRILRGHTSRVWSVTFSPDGSMCASANHDRTVRLWSTKTGDCIGILEKHTNWVWSVAFSPDGNILASSSSDHNINLWERDVKTGKFRLLEVLSVDTVQVLSVAFSPDGKWLVSSGDDHTIRLWDINKKQCIHSFEGHESWIRSVVFSPKGSLFASGSDDCTVRLWDVKERKLVKTWHDHTSWVCSVAFDPTGGILASGSYDKTIRLWDVEKHTHIKTLDTDGGIHSVAFNSDGLTLASGSVDETIKIWDVNSNKWLNPLRSKRPYEGMNITEVTGLSETQKNTLKALGALEN